MLDINVHAESFAAVGIFGGWGFGGPGALAGPRLLAVHAGESHVIPLALIGCGGRGSGAVGNPRESTGGPVKLVAMADFFETRLQNSYKVLRNQFGDRIDVPAERQFAGFSRYKQAIDCLRPGDVAMLGGYAAWRPVQLEYAVRKGVHVFMEKSFTTDPPACAGSSRPARSPKRKT